MNSLWNREKLLEQSAAFQEARILITAAELDLFTALKMEPVTAEDLAEVNGWSLRALRILLDALSAMGVLSKSASGLYSLDEELCRLLDKSSQDSILPMILHRGRMWQSWSTLTQIVQTGLNQNRLVTETRSLKDMEDFIGAMHVVGRDMAEEIADAVDLRRHKRMLDVGGGSGTYIMAFLKRAPHMTATLFDLPEVMDMARNRLTENGFSERVTLVAGDYDSDELPAGHDLTFLSAIIHSNGREANTDLFRRIYSSLEPGGTILIRDHFMDEARLQPLSGAIFAVNMLAATKEGDSHRFEDVKTDLESMGFKDVRMIRDGGQMDQLVAAVKQV